MSALRVYAVGAALLAATACSGGGGLDEGPQGQGTPSAPVASQPSITTLPTTPAPTTAAPAKTGGVTVGKYASDPAVEGFVAYLQARFDAFRQRDPRHAPLLATTTQNRQSHDRARIQRMIADGERYEGKLRFAIVGAATTGTRARIRACERDDASWFVGRTGERSPTKPRWLPLDVRMVRTGGVWKVDAAFDANFSCREAR